MNAYKLSYDVNIYRQLQWKNKEENVLELAKPLLTKGSESLSPLSLEWMVEDGVTDLPKPDIAYLQGYSPALIVNQKAFDTLLPSIEQISDNIKLDIENEAWYIIRLHTISNEYLDLENCSFKIRRSGGIGRLLKAAYKPEAIENNLLFVAEQDSVNIIANDRFKQLIDDNKLTGLTFN